MQIKTTEFGAFLNEVMKDMLRMGCFEKTNRNDGICIEKIIKEYDNNIPIIVRNRIAKYQGKGSKQLAYCAMLVNVVIDIAIQRFTSAFGVTKTINPLREGGENVAYTKTLLSEARRVGLRVDKIPAAGAIFMNATSGDGTTSGYHVGMVWYYDEKRKVIGTCEGNTSPGYFLGEDNCLVRSPKNGIVTKERSSKKAKWYIHIEEFFSKDKTADVIVVTSALNDSLYGADFCLLDIPVQDTEDISPDVDPGIANDYSGNNNDLIRYVFAAGGIAAVVYYAFIRKGK